MLKTYAYNGNPKGWTWLQVWNINISGLACWRIYVFPINKNDNPNLHLSNTIVFCTYSAEVSGGARFPAKSALQEHFLQLVTEASHHLGGVDAVSGSRAVIVEVQQTQETPFVAVFEEEQALLYDRVVGIHEVHPVAAVVQVFLGQCGHAEHIFITQSDRWEGHVASPHHVDLCDGWVGHQVLDSV